MCEYCDLTIEKSLLEDRTYRREVYMFIDENGLNAEMYSDKGFSGHGYVKINYCPMCGRKM